MRRWLRLRSLTAPGLVAASATASAIGLPSARSLATRAPGSGSLREGTAVNATKRLFIAGAAKGLMDALAEADDV